MKKSKVIISSIAALAASAVVAKAIARRRRNGVKFEAEIKAPGRNGRAKVRARRSSSAHSSR